jgi:antitoxin (DNA-binding transcriptional repressor) of toxin-antitoxin stability system
MKMVTTHEAKTHLSRLLKEVSAGEDVVIMTGREPTARITAYKRSTHKRPKPGSSGSDPVVCSKDAFAPLTDDELKVWGL